MSIVKVPGLGNCITVTQAREALGISRQAVHQAIKAGHLRARRFHGALGTFVCLADVQVYRDLVGAPRGPKPQSL